MAAKLAENDGLSAAGDVMGGSGERPTLRDDADADSVLDDVDERKEACETVGQGRRPSAISW